MTETPKTEPTATPTAEGDPTATTTAVQTLSSAWDVTLSGYVGTPPAFDGEYLYVTTYEDCERGDCATYKVHSLDMDGTVRWEKQITFQGGGQGPDPMLGTPTATGNAIYVGTGASTISLTHDGGTNWRSEHAGTILGGPIVQDGTVFVAGYDGTVSALDIATGDAQWSETPSQTVFETNPTLHDGTLYVGDARGVTYALDAASGQRRWEFRDETPSSTFRRIRTPPVVRGDTVFTATMRTIDGIGANSGDLQWQYAEAGTRGPIAVAGETVFAQSGDELVALDAATGEAAWTYDVGHGPSGPSTGVAASGNHVFTGGSELTVHRVDGTLVARFTGDGRFGMPHLLDGGLLATHGKTVSFVETS